MYIGGDFAVLITFDEEGKDKIAEAKETINSIRLAFGKIGANTETEQEVLDDTINILEGILEGRPF